MSDWRELEQILKKGESESLEYKIAKTDFSRLELKKYCSAFSNSGGGDLILGVDDSGTPIGTSAYPKYHELPNDLLSELGIKVDVVEYTKDDLRVLRFIVPEHEPGKAVKCEGIRYVRVGSSVREMEDADYMKILMETAPDFSGEVQKEFSLNDIDENAISNFKKLWSEKSGKSEYLNYSTEEVLKKLGLINKDEIRNAAIILFGKKEKIDEFFPGSEIILEWRSNPLTTNYDFRWEWREPFFKIMEEIWKNINVRNSKISIQEGLFQRDIYIFSEKPVREAILNAVTHRNYRINYNSIFIKFSPKSFIIKSPGGFLSDITPENVLNKQAWRNRYIAETFQRVRLVERAGQGVDDIFKFTIQEGKGIPDFSKSDKSEVVLEIPAQIKDVEFVKFLSSVAKEDNIELDFDDIYELENIRENKKASNSKSVEKLINFGIIEKIPYKRNQYMLCKKYYVALDRKGEYTRTKGLDRDTYKALLVKHIENYGKGCMKEFIEVLPNLKRTVINNLVKELAKTDDIEFVGQKKNGFWIKKRKTT